MLSRTLGLWRRGRAIVFPAINKMSRAVLRAIGGLAPVRIDEGGGGGSPPRVSIREKKKEMVTLSFRRPGKGGQGLLIEYSVVSP